MEWKKESDTLEVSGPYRVERREGYWMAFAPGEDLAIFVADEPTFTSNTREDDLDLAKAAVEKYASDKGAD